jgi:hypothetical protein
LRPGPQSIGFPRRISSCIFYICYMLLPSFFSLWLKNYHRETQLTR